MTPRDMERVFGRGRLRMRTGEHVEVFREATGPGERRCYTKRFLAAADGDLREWTEREWRILARMVGHGIRCVPEVVQFDRGTGGQPPLVKTCDAGVTVDHWATLLPVERDGRILGHVFQDCAHWWALAQHLLRALEQVHALGVIHLDLKADNVCIPLEPVGFRPDSAGQVLRPLFPQLALIDFAFSLVAGEELGSPLPIGRQQEFDYQSPRLLSALGAGAGGDLQPTRELDWRCDMYSLAALLERYLPPLQGGGHDRAGWTAERTTQALALVRAIRDRHAQENALVMPHAELRAVAAGVLAQPDLAASLARGWSLANGPSELPAAATTPVTRLAPPPRAARAGRRPPGAGLAPLTGARPRIGPRLAFASAVRGCGAGGDSGGHGDRAGSLGVGPLARRSGYDGRCRDAVAVSGAAGVARPANPVHEPAARRRGCRKGGCVGTVPGGHGSEQGRRRRGGARRSAHSSRAGPSCGGSGPRRRGQAARAGAQEPGGGQGREGGPASAAEGLRRRPERGTGGRAARAGPCTAEPAARRDRAAACHVFGRARADALAAGEPGTLGSAGPGERAGAARARCDQRNVRLGRPQQGCGGGLPHGPGNVEQARGAGERAGGSAVAPRARARRRLSAARVQADVEQFAGRPRAVSRAGRAGASRSYRAPPAPASRLAA